MNIYICFYNSKIRNEEYNLSLFGGSFSGKNRINFLLLDSKFAFRRSNCAIKRKLFILDSTHFPLSCFLSYDDYLPLIHVYNPRILIGTTTYIQHQHLRFSNILVRTRCRWWSWKKVMRNLPNAAPQFSFHWCSLFIHMLQVTI